MKFGKRSRVKVLRLLNSDALEASASRYKFLKKYKPPVSSKLYSGSGDLVSDFSSEKRIFVPYNAIPETVIYSFLSA